MEYNHTVYKEGSAYIKVEGWYTREEVLNLLQTLKDSFNPVCSKGNESTN